MVINNACFCIGNICGNSSCQCNYTCKCSEKKAQQKISWSLTIKEFPKKEKCPECEKDTKQLLLEEN